jgi:hypothetical protein
MDVDNDGIANSEDNDNDNDGQVDAFDARPFDASEQIDTDNDGIGNNADLDDDNDGIQDALDHFPLDIYETFDSDGDGVGDNADKDSDMDLIPDLWEIKYALDPLDSSDALIDHDGDGFNALEEFERGSVPFMALDIDANGNVDALTDGLIILRYLFGLRNDALISNAIADGSVRSTSEEIETYIHSLMPSF